MEVPYLAWLLFSSFIEIINNIFFLFGYISNVNSFPQPLTHEEEQYYLKLLKEGDEEARNILIERNLRLVAHIVKNTTLPQMSAMTLSPLVL